MAATSLAAASLAVTTFSSWQQSKKKAPAPVTPTIVPTPSATDDALSANLAGEQAAAVQRKRAQQAVGPRSTILTSPQGVSTPAPGRTLLLGR